MIILALSLLLLGISAYLLRSLRALHRKINRNADRVSRELAGQTSRIKEEIGHVYHQVEALEQLLPILKLKAPLPASRGWAASPDFLLALSHITQNVRPKLAVELGSGTSTLVLAKSGAKKIISLDHSLDFGAQTQEMLESHRVGGVEIRINELETYPEGYRWYAHSSLKGLAKIDLLVIDGPPSSTNPDARYPALTHLIPLLSAKATIVLDDADRDEEKKLAEEIAAALPGHSLTFIRHEKGTAVIAPLKR
jgi:predicted O-methyltransferase YrrM